jgi:hypothetical protein
MRTVYDQVARTSKFHHQMGVYVQQPLAGDQQTTQLLIHGFIVLL